jgi:hypothetical protein
MHDFSQYIYGLDGALCVAKVPVIGDFFSKKSSLYFRNRLTTLDLIKPKMYFLEGESK